MFESDQHDFDEEYAEVSHPAPPLARSAPPAQSASPARSASAVATIEAPPVAAPAVPVPFPATATSAPQEPNAQRIYEPAEAGEPEQAEAEQGEDGKPPPVEAPRKKPNFIRIGGFAALIALVVVVVITVNRPKADARQPGDLGPGIVAVAGLRGHLDTRWDGNAKTGRLVYQLRIESMEDRWGAGFSRVTSNPPMPLSVNVRLLDSSGFALCGKEIDFSFNPQNAEVAIPVSAQLGADGKKLSAAARAAAFAEARQSQIAQMQAAEVARERGKDLFQNQIATDGQVGAVNVQGTLPCAPDQYQRADYWDFNTNFPSLEEQAVLLDPKSALHAQAVESPGHLAKRSIAKARDGFTIQGDDRVTGYDSARGMLWAEQKSFAIDKRFGETTAADWASKYTLIHYKCDQHASCALTAAGQAAVLHARLQE